MKNLKKFSILVIGIFLLVMMLPITQSFAAEDLSNLSFNLEGDNIIEVCRQLYAKAGDTLTLVAYNDETGEKVQVPENVVISKVELPDSENKEDEDYGKEPEYIIDETGTKITVNTKQDLYYRVANKESGEIIDTISVVTVSEEKYNKLIPTIGAENLEYRLEGENVVEFDGHYYTKVGDTLTLVAYNETTGEKVPLPENIIMNGTGRLESSTDEDYGNPIKIELDETGTKITFNSKHSISYNVVNAVTNINSTVGGVSMTAVSEEKYRELTVNEVTEPTTENILSAIADYKTTIVTLNSADAIDTEVFEKLQNCEKATLQLNLGNITWEFKSSDITKTDSMLATGIQISTEKFEYIKPNDINDGLFIEFAHDGKLPGKAEITIYVGTEKYGEGQKDLNLYYYNDITAQYEEMGTVKYNNGNVTLSLDHCSTYVLTEQKLESSESPVKEPEKNEENEKDETPKTGVNNVYIAVAVTLVAISVGSIVLIKKNK